MPKNGEIYNTMTNIILLITCVLCGYACGKYFEKRVRRKGEFFVDLHRYATLLKVNVDGRRVQLDTFNAEFCENCSAVFCDYMRSGKLKCNLTATQKQNLEKFFANLSCACSQELVEHLDYFSAAFDTDCKQVAENEVAKASVYVKVGLLIGAMIGIMFM